MATQAAAMFTKQHNDVYAAIDPTLERVSAEGKFIAITGGGSGIGPHIAEAFAKAGAAKIALLGRTERTLLSKKQSLESKYLAQVSIHIADVGQEAAVNKAFEELGNLGPIDVLVSNTGYLPDKFSSPIPTSWTGGLLTKSMSKQLY
jgi:NAD(P)-dependent dehydrogenase (short-subunit alcohol dehydrogenase family)